MTRYEHAQFGWVTVLGLLIVGGGVLISGLSHSPQEARSALLGTAAVLFILVLLFHSLKTRVSDTEIKVSFGIGLISRYIPLHTIESCKVIKKGFILGWGIRFGLGFTIWNVSGFDSVELKFKDKDRRFRIGTDRPEELCEAIESVLRAQPHAGKTG